LVTIGGFLLFVAGDAGTPYDGPGPYILAAVALLVAVLPWPAAAALALLTNAFFLTGAFVNPEAPAALANPGRLRDFIGAVLEVGGLAISGVAAMVLTWTLVAAFTSGRRATARRR
jgi:hypothetical protein